MKIKSFLSLFVAVMAAILISSCGADKGLSSADLSMDNMEDSNTVDVSNWVPLTIDLIRKLNLNNVTITLLPVAPMREIMFSRSEIQILKDKTEAAPFGKSKLVTTNVHIYSNRKYYIAEANDAMTKLTMPSDTMIAKSEVFWGRAENGAFYAYHNSGVKIFPDGTVHVLFNDKEFHMPMKCMRIPLMCDTTGLQINIIASGAAKD